MACGVVGYSFSQSDHSSDGGAGGNGTCGGGDGCGGAIDSSWTGLGLAGLGRRVTSSAGDGCGGDSTKRAGGLA